MDLHLIFGDTNAAAMTSVMAAFGIALAGIALVAGCVALQPLVPRRRDRHSEPGPGSAATGAR
jgi:hypothetical protein